MNSFSSTWDSSEVLLYMNPLFFMTHSAGTYTSGECYYVQLVWTILEWFCELALDLDLFIFNLFWIVSLNWWGWKNVGAIIIF